MTETHQLSLRYDGEALNSHEMDARDLAPAMIGLCDLVDEANRTFNDGRSRIDIKVRTLRDGSFQIDIALVQSIVEQAVGLLSGTHVTALLSLLGLLGLAKGVGVGVIELIRRLRGLSPKSVKDLGDGRADILLPDGQTLQVSKDALILYQSKKVRESVHRMVKPLERDGIDSLDVMDGTDVIQRVLKNDVECFTPTSEETRKVTERRTMLRIQSLWFHGDNKWRFTEGETTIPATIEDQDFIERMLELDEPFHPSDHLEVILEKTEIASSDGGVRREYSVKKVLNHIKSPRQQKLGL